MGMLECWMPCARATSPPPDGPSLPPGFGHRESTAKNAGGCNLSKLHRDYKRHVQFQPSEKLRQGAGKR